MKNKRNKKFLNKLLLIATVIAFIIFMIAGSQMNAQIAEAQELEGWTILQTVRPTPTPVKEEVVLPPGVVEIIKFNFKDLGEKVVNEALLVARCESELRPDAINDKNRNKTRDDGTFQVNSIHGVPVKFLHNPKVNVAIARQLYDEWKGWEPWRSSNKCHGLLK